MINQVESWSLIFFQMLLYFHNHIKIMQEWENKEYEFWSLNRMDNVANSIFTRTLFLFALHGPP
mgnify:CR=1 FL=1